MLQIKCDLCNRFIPETKDLLLLKLERDGKSAIPEQEICPWCKEIILKLVNNWQVILENWGGDVTNGMARIKEEEK